MLSNTIWTAKDYINIICFTRLYYGIVIHTILIAIYYNTCSNILLPVLGSNGIHVPALRIQNTNYE